MEAVLDKFGRIMIPKEVRKHLGLKPGMVLEVEEQDHEVVLKPTKQYLVKRKGKVLVYTGKAEGDIESSLKETQKARMKKLGKF